MTRLEAVIKVYPKYSEYLLLNAHCPDSNNKLILATRVKNIKACDMKCETCWNLPTGAQNLNEEGLD